MKFLLPIFSFISTILAHEIIDDCGHKDKKCAVGVLGVDYGNGLSPIGNERRF